MPSLTATCSVNSSKERNRLHNSLNATYRRHENIKKRSYEQRVQEVEHGSFTRSISFLCIWRHDTICNNHLQETDLTDIRKATAGLQQNHCMDQMPAELFIGQILSDVPWRSTILLPPPNETRPPRCGRLRRSLPTHRTVHLHLVCKMHYFFTLHQKTLMGGGALKLSSYGNLAKCHQALFRIPHVGLGTRLLQQGESEWHTYCREVLFAGIYFWNPDSGISSTVPSDYFPALCTPRPHM